MMWHTLTNGGAAGFSVLLDNYKFIRDGPRVMAFVKYGLLVFRIGEDREFELIKKEFTKIFLGKTNHKTSFDALSLPMYYENHPQRLVALLMPLEVTGGKGYITFIHSQSTLMDTSLVLIAEHKNIDMLIIDSTPPNSSLWIRTLEKIEDTFTQGGDPPPVFDILISPSSLFHLDEDNTIVPSDSRGNTDIQYLLYFSNILLPAALTERNIVKMACNNDELCNTAQLRTMALQADNLYTAYNHPYSKTCHIIFKKNYTTTTKSVVDRFFNLKRMCKNCEGDPLRAHNYASTEKLRVIPKSEFNPLQCLGFETIISEFRNHPEFHLTTAESKTDQIDMHVCCFLNFLLEEVSNIFCLWPTRGVYNKFTDKQKERANHTFLRNFLGVLWINDFALINVIVR